MFVQRVLVALSIDLFAVRSAFNFVSVPEQSSCFKFRKQELDNVVE